MINFAGEGTCCPDKGRRGPKFAEFFLKRRILPPMSMLTTPRPRARHTMKVNFLHSSFPTLTFVLASLLPAVALAGPDTVYTTRTEVRQQTVVPLHKKLADKVLIACGVVEPAPVYVAPGYLEITGPTSMMVYRRPAPLSPRHVTPSTEGEQKPTAAPAAPVASPVPSPAAITAPSPAPMVPVPAPAPTDPEPGLLPETGTSNPAGQNRTDELLSYFQRQRPVPHANNGSPQISGGQGPNDSAEEPSFLQTPQAPEQPALPPSRATYHVTP